MTHPTATPSGRGAAGGASTATRISRWLRARTLIHVHASIRRFRLFELYAGPKDYARAWGINLVILECELSATWGPKDTWELGRG